MKYYIVKHPDVKQSKTTNKLFSPMLNLQTYYFKLDFQKVDQHTGGKWLIHGTKRRKDNSCKAWNSPVEYPSWIGKHAQSNIQGEFPGTETSREMCICRTRLTYVKEA